MPSFPTALKALLQLGPEPIALNALYKFGLWTGHYRRTERAGLEPRRARRTAEDSGIPELFSLPDLNQLSNTMGPGGEAQLLAEAEEIVAGKFRLFGGDPVPLRLTFDEPLCHWTEYERGKAAIPYSGHPIRDIKFIWEPARFGWAFTLGRAYYLSSKPSGSGPAGPLAEGYAEAFWKYFEQFTVGNPPYLGPNWMNGQEVAIRLMALVWVAQVFGTAAASRPDRRAALMRSIEQHAQRIPLTLVYARSQNNNHLVLEAAALFTAGMALDQSKWHDLGWYWLNRSLQHQISSYGEYIQHSTNYHRVMLQAALWVDAILRAQGERWPSATLEALTRASHWLFSMIDPISGRAPNLGANDGALILPMSAAAFEDFRPTVQAAARAFLRTGLPAGPWDELSLWLGLSPSQRTADSDAYMAEHLRGRNSWGYLRASRFKSRLLHADQLHFDLWWRGINVAKDGGSYLYNADPPWDNPLVSTRVHNTVTVDGMDQMSRAGRFLMLDWFPAYSKSLLEVDERISGRMLAYHKGYQRRGVRHERIATVYTDERWEIRDNLILTRPGEHTFRLHWLLMDGAWSLVNGEGGVEVRLAAPAGRVTVCVRSEPAFANLPSSLSLVRAGELLHGARTLLPFEGWASPTYGVKVPALSLALEATASRSISFVTEFLFSNEPAGTAGAQ